MKKKTKSSSKNILKKLDEKTEWIIRIYFWILPAMGVIAVSILIANLITEYIYPPATPYFMLIGLGIYFLNLIVIWLLATKTFKISVSIISALFIIIQLIRGIYP